MDSYGYSGNAHIGYDQNRQKPYEFIGLQSFFIHIKSSVFVEAKRLLSVYVGSFLEGPPMHFAMCNFASLAPIRNLFITMKKRVLANAFPNRWFEHGGGHSDPPHLQTTCLGTRSRGHFFSW